MRKILFVMLLLISFVSGCKPKIENYITINKSDYTVHVGEIIELDISISNDEEYDIEIYDPDIVRLVDAFKIEGTSVGDTIILIKVREEEKSVIIRVIDDSSYQVVGLDEVEVGLNSEYSLEKNDNRIDGVIWSVDNSELASINQSGDLTFLLSGDITLNAIVDGDIVASKIITIKPKKIEEISYNIDPYVLVGEETSIIIDAKGNDLTWTSSNEEVATVDNDGVVSFIKEGTAIIRVSLTDQPSVFFEQEFYVRSSDNLNTNKIIVDQEIIKSSAEIFYYDGLEYSRNINVFGNINDAINASEKDSIITLAPGVYNEDITLSKSNIKLVGPNMDIDPTTKARTTEAIITSKVIVSSKVSHLTINGISFTQDATITLEGENNVFTFINNIISNTTQTKEVWVENDTYFGAFLSFLLGREYTDDVVIENNQFINIGDIAINLSYINNFKVINNVFDGFSRDAIRVSNGIVSKSSQWLIRNNTFKNGLYNGIYFRTYGSNMKYIQNSISIFDNKFTDVGKTNVLFSGAISFRNYQEGLTTINISYNQFEECTNYILLRNNAASNNQSNFSAYISYNSFIGLPSSYYLRNKNNSDTSNTNPSLIEITNNYYGLSNDTEVDISKHQSKFMGVKGDVSAITEASLKKVPRVYGVNNVYLDSNPKIIASGEVSFTSNDSSLFTVDSKGIITPIKEGVGYVTVSSKTEQVKFPIVIKERLDPVYLLLKAAYNEEGYKEGPNNDTKFGDWYGLPNAEWCAMFVSWCSNQAGIPTTIIPKYAAVSAGMAWYQERGLFEYKEDYVPKTGDLIFFKSNGASHTGIVISCDGNTVYTIEGNTSDMVLKRSYKLDYNKITGYGLPAYPSYDGSNYDFDISGATDGEGHSTR